MTGGRPGSARRCVAAWLVLAAVSAFVPLVAAGKPSPKMPALYTNADGVLNDDQYEYDEVALPDAGAQPCAPTSGLAASLEIGEGLPGPGGSRR